LVMTVDGDTLNEDYVFGNRLHAVEDADIAAAVGIEALVGIAVATVECVVPTCRVSSLAAVEMDLVVEAGPETGAKIQKVDSEETIESGVVVNRIAQREIRWAAVVQ